jgi:hypothetical protein
VDDADTTATFLGSRAANILRAAADPDLAENVHVFVGAVTDYFEQQPSIRGDPQYDALSRLTLDDIPRQPEPLVFVLAPFYRGDDAASHPRLNEQEPGLWASETLPEISVGSGIGIGSLEFGPSSHLGISTATIATLIVLSILGLGYARVAFDDLVTVIATAPAFGAAALTLVAVVLDRLGLRLTGLPVALAASALTGLGGLALLLIMKRVPDR